MFKKAKVAPSLPQGLPLCGLNEIRTSDRWRLEDRARSLTHSAYLGNGLALCRILGRYKLYVPTSDVGFGAHVMLEGMWEPWITTFMAHRIKTGAVVADVGANHGYYTLLLADLVGPRGRVAAIEPHPDTCRLLRLSIEVNGFSSRTTVYECAAVANDHQQLRFHTPTHEPKNARIVWDEPGIDTLTVLGMTLGSVLDGWPRLDFIKIDVEGAEEAAIMGAWSRIEADRPELLLEYNPGRCADPASLLDRLEAAYGAIRILDFDSRLVPVGRDKLLNAQHTEDWMVFCSPTD